MEIREQIIKLYHLSQFDAGLIEFEQELADIPEQLDGWERDLAKVKGRLETELQALAALEKSYREKEAQLAETKDWIKDSEAKLFRIKTQKEYQAGVSEIAERKQHIAEIEDEMLELMSQVENRKAALNRVQAAFDAKLEEANEAKATLEVRRKELEEKLAAEKSVWEQKAEGIDESLLALYERARSDNPDAATVIDRGACQGCYFSLPPQMVIEVQRMKTVHACPTCHRLLFMEETIANPAVTTDVGD